MKTQYFEVEKIEPTTEIEEISIRDFCNHFDISTNDKSLNMRDIMVFMVVSNRFFIGNEGRTPIHKAAGIKKIQVDRSIRKLIRKGYIKRINNELQPGEKLL